ncbi:hypothetical protein CICLE_v10017895mg [Citrus x clementina]|uniref:Protein kinase domain-containing protein n=1 Tax=Citrus clementina TaxID=85681 RepID=V4UBR4_CITCL|nr:hypothetical protein CICLE_v10017895mg [Citrus x clementina]
MEVAAFHSHLFPEKSFALKIVAIFFYTDRVYALDYYKYLYAYFVNCSRDLIDQAFIRVSCLSGGNRSNVYVNYHGSYVSDFSESCSFVSMVPVHNGNVENPSYETLREFLETGFDLRWSVGCRNCYAAAGRECISTDRTGNIDYFDSSSITNLFAGCRIAQGVFRKFICYQQLLTRNKPIVTDRNRGTQIMRLYASVDDGCADCWRRASGMLTLVVWDARVPHGFETSRPVTNGIRAALVISRSPRCELAKRSNAAPRRSPLFQTQGSTSGMNRQVLTPPSIRTKWIVSARGSSPRIEDESAHLRGVLFMHEDVHGYGGGRMSRTAIVAPKLCTYTLVSIMVVLIVRDVLQEFSYKHPTPLEWLLLVFLLFLIHKYRTTLKTIDNIEKFLHTQQSWMPKRYFYPEIIAMTNHFTHKLGQGGFGSVYKGQLHTGRLIAVKMLENSKFSAEEFINEVSTIGRIHHVNVVQLLGFCSEGSKRALVYEFMPNGSLDRHIFPKESRGQSFSWEKLHEVALGTARGMEYLHNGCDVCIPHFDIKPHNILLDHNFIPKVSDFGLAKFLPKENDFVSLSATRGTIGYIAPELISRNFGTVSCKLDVYGFGMVLLEMAGGRRNSNMNASRSSKAYFPSWVYDQLNKGGDLELQNVTEIESMIARKLCMIGLWCIQVKAADCLSMTKVLEMLEGSIDDLQMPPRPFFSS